MECSEINKWINNTSDFELNNPTADIMLHLNNCRNCKKKINTIQNSLNYLDSQKNETLSEKKTNEIIELLVRKKQSRLSTQRTNGEFIFSRVAAILIIAFGLLVGIITGGLLFADTNENDNPWSNEFSLLSDNTDYILFE